MKIRIPNELTSRVGDTFICLGFTAISFVKEKDEANYKMQLIYEHRNVYISLDCEEGIAKRDYHEILNLIEEKCNNTNQLIK